MEYLSISWCATFKMIDRFLIFRYFFLVAVVRSLINCDQLHHREEIVPFSQASHQDRRFRSSSPMYSSWSLWSPCSSTCGPGVSKRTRLCNKKENEALCHGNSTEFKVCKFQDCLQTDLDFRAFQCSQYNNRLVAGQQIKAWVPIDGGANPCELRCEADSEKLVFVFGKAADGTPCSQGVCLDGRCLKVGCDDRIGSGAEWDMCGLCSGRNSTCVHYTDIFRSLPKSSNKKERRPIYQEIVVLPVSSRNFKIWKNIDENILAVRDRSKSLIFRKDTSPSNTSIAGAVIGYSTEHKLMTITVNGPIAEELYVLALFRENNSKIHYEYWLPLDQPHRQTFYSKKPLFSSQTSIYPPHHQTIPPRTTLTSSSYLLTSPKPIIKSEKSLSKQTDIVYSIQNTSPYVPKLKSSASTEANGLKYGPKRFQFELSPWKSRLIPSNSHLTNMTEHIRSSNTTYFDRNDYFPNYRFNIKTQKPAFNYYEKYRNSSVISKTGIYQKKSIFLPDQTQDDSSISSDTKNSALPKETKKKSKTKKPKKVHADEEKNQNQDKDLTARWKYQINGDHDTLKGSFLNTPVSITVLPLPDSFNVSKSSKEFVGHNLPSKPRLTRGGLCEPCQKVRDLTKHFCSSDFVIQATVIGYEFLHGETRYELNVRQSFKNILALLPREYIWSPDTCRCPKLRIGKEYLIMGKIDNYYRRNESRLLVDKSCFARIFNGKHERRLNKLKKNRNRKCAKMS